jgi:plastocyanin
MLPAARNRRAHRSHTGRRMLAGAIIASVLLAACTSGPAFTPLPSGADLPSDCATADRNNVISLSAQNLDFSAPCMIAPADTPFTIRFTNLEGVPHDVALYATPERVNEYFRGEVITGPDTTIDYAIDPIPAGDHFFDCILHPADMRGAVYVR